MIKFLFKGLIRDRSRSLFPVITVSIGVILTVVGYSWVMGAMTSFIDSSARFDSGHVKIMSRAYAKEKDQVPNDLAYIGVEDLLRDLKTRHPDMIWTPRIKFGGLLDIPDENGETKAQGPVAGLAIDLLSSESPEWKILNIEKALVRGRLPENPGEVLISDDLAIKLGVDLEETATLISSTMYGNMSMTNFTVVGTLHFGMTAMDRGAMLADINGIQSALDMDDATGEILGFYSDFIYRHEAAVALESGFNSEYTKENDEFSPVMGNLRDQSGLGVFFDMIDMFINGIIVIFITVISIVLWNTGLMSSLRRYGEIGVRLAVGESKGHLYRSMIGESLVIGAFGSIIGTAIGLAFSYYIQVKGIDISYAMKNASLFLPDVMRAQVTTGSYYIGFIPGLAASFLGASISGLGIFRRQTSQLMKELEV